MWGLDKLLTQIGSPFLYIILVQQKFSICAVLKQLLVVDVLRPELFSYSSSLLRVKGHWIVYRVQSIFILRNCSHATHRLLTTEAPLSAWSLRWNQSLDLIEMNVSGEPWRAQGLLEAAKQQSRCLTKGLTVLQSIHHFVYVFQPARKIPKRGLNCQWSPDTFLGGGQNVVTGPLRRSELDDDWKSW